MWAAARARPDPRCYDYTAKEEGDLSVGSPTGLSPRFHAAISSPNSSVESRNGTLQNPKDKRTHSWDSTGSSSFAHRKYQPALFTGTNNKYHLHDVQSNLQNTADSKVMPSASKESSSRRRRPCRTPLPLPDLRGFNKRSKTQHCNYDGVCVKSSVPSCCHTLKLLPALVKSGLGTVHARPVDSAAQRHFLLIINQICVTLCFQIPGTSK